MRAHSLLGTWVGGMLRATGAVPTIVAVKA